LIDRCVGHTTDVAVSGGAVTYRLHGERDQHNYDRNASHTATIWSAQALTKPVPRFVPSTRRGISVGVNSGGSRSASIPQELPQMLANVGTIWNSHFCVSAGHGAETAQTARSATRPVLYEEYWKDR